MLLLPACADPSPPRPDIVLVSLDTTRADFVTPEVSPRVTSLAAKGTRFSWALAHAPTTLSSHATVWTGLDPHGTRVVRNGTPLERGVDTLPARLQDAGYDTVAVIGASVLERSQGLARGFRVYDERLGVDRTRRDEARAREVTDRALERAKGRDPDRPLFLFVHYFDAHGPYDAPAPWTRVGGDPAYAGPVDGSQASVQALAEAIRARTADPADLTELRARYRGEVAYVDAEVGRLLDGLALKDPVVVVFGDHGEMLGEDPHRPIGHGPDVDLPASHVPLVFSGPGVPVATVDGVVGLRDVGATVLGLAGLAPTLGDGRDLATLWRGEPDPRTVMLEATQPVDVELADAWPNLEKERGIARDGHLLVRAPWLGQSPALYALAPGQPLVVDRARLDALVADLAAWDAAAGAHRSTRVDADIAEKLKALGYRD
ncbi:MAG: sulfatase [Myxococcota bacterium]